MKLCFPCVGMRILKTILAIFVVLVLGELFWPYPPVFAVVVAILSMQDTVSNSLSFGFARIMSILIGGSVGLLLLMLGVSDLSPLWSIPILCASAFACLYFTLMIRQPRATAYALAMLFLAYFGVGETGEQYITVLRRIAETVSGIIIAVLINMSIRSKPTPCETDETHAEERGQV